MLPQEFSGFPVNLAIVGNTFMLNWKNTQTWTFTSVTEYYILRKNKT